MDLLSKIGALRSLSIVGMAKNTGKTVCLNYVLDQLQRSGKVIAVTSIGLDGEKSDQVTQTEKPEIELAEGIYFVTSEYHYRQRQLLSEICQLSAEMTSLGRLVTAKVLQKGKVVLTGPASTSRIRALMDQMEELGVELTIVDGALSRKSPASPAITEGMILTTGAALAADFNTVVNKTMAVYRLMQLPVFETPMKESMMMADSGIYALNEDRTIRLPIDSPLLFPTHKESLFQYGSVLFVSGIVTDSMLDHLRLQPNIKEVVLVVKDFTKLFVSSMALTGFLQRGGQLKVLKQPNLLAICVNPTSPTGYKIDSEQLCSALQAQLDVPVLDVMRVGQKRG